MTKPEPVEITKARPAEWAKVFESYEIDEVLADRAATACIQKMDFFPTPKQFIEQLKLVKASFGAFAGKEILEKTVQNSELSVELANKLREMEPVNVLKRFQTMAHIKKTASHMNWDSMTGKDWVRNMISCLNEMV